MSKDNKTDSEKMREYYNKFLAAPDIKSKKIFARYMLGIKNRTKKSFNFYGVSEEKVKGFL